MSSWSLIQDQTLAFFKNIEEDEFMMKILGRVILKKKSE